MTMINAQRAAGPAEIERFAGTNICLVGRIPQVRPTAPDLHCLIADIRMPGMSGLGMQAKLNAGSLQDSDDFYHGPRGRKNADAGLKAGAVDSWQNHLTMKPCSRAFEQPWRVEPKASVHAARGVLGGSYTNIADW